MGVLVSSMPGLAESVEDPPSLTNGSDDRFVIPTTVGDCADCVPYHIAAGKGAAWHPLFTPTARLSPGEEIVSADWSNDSLLWIEDNAVHTPVDDRLAIRTKTTGGRPAGGIAINDVASSDINEDGVEDVLVLDYAGGGVHRLLALSPDSGDWRMLWNGTLPSVTPTHAALRSIVDNGTHGAFLRVANVSGDQRAEAIVAGSAGILILDLPASKTGSATVRATIDPLPLAPEPPAPPANWCKTPSIRLGAHRQITHLDVSEAGVGGPSLLAVAMVGTQVCWAQRDSGPEETYFKHQWWTEYNGSTNVVVYAPAGEAGFETRRVFHGEDYAPEEGRPQNIAYYRDHNGYFADDGRGSPFPKLAHRVHLNFGVKDNYVSMTPAFGDTDGDGADELVLRVSAMTFPFFHYGVFPQYEPIVTSGFIVEKTPGENVTRGRGKTIPIWDSKCRDDVPYHARSHPLLGPRSREALILADFDEDGREEIACLSGTPSAPSIVVHDGDERTAATAFRLKDDAYALTAWQSGDRGARDLVVLRGDGGVSVLRARVARSDTGITVAGWDAIAQTQARGAPIRYDRSPSAPYAPVVPADVDRDGLYVRWLGPDEGLETLITNPQILLVAGAPPTVAGVGQDWGSTALEAVASRCSEDETMSFYGFTWEVGAEAEFSAGLIVSKKVGGFEFLGSMSRQLEESDTKSVCFDRAKEWESSGPTDNVLFRQYPVDLYYYEIVGAADPSLIGQHTAVKLYGKPRVAFWPVDSYNKAVARYNGWRQSHSDSTFEPGLLVPRDLFTQTPGDPRTYPQASDVTRILTAAADLVDRTAHERLTKSLKTTNGELLTTGNGFAHLTTELDLFVGTSEVQDVGKAPGSTGLGISRAHARSHSESWTMGGGASVELSEGTVKVAFAFEIGRGESWTIMNEHSTGFSATVPSIEDEIQHAKHAYKWGLMTYPVEVAGTIFGVVNYWVDDYRGTGPEGVVEQAPEIAAPLPGSQVSPDIAFHWRPVPAARSYELNLVLVQPASLQPNRTFEIDHDPTNATMTWSPERRLVEHGFYDVRVRALDKLERPGPWSDAVRFYVSAPPEDAPREVESQTERGGGFSVRWAAVEGEGADNLDAATHYEIEVASGPSGSSPTVHTTSALQWREDAGPGTWTARVRALNAAGPGPWSRAVTATVAPAPEAPVLTLLQTRGAPAIASWTAHPGATAYEIDLNDFRTTVAGANRSWALPSGASTGGHVLRVRGIGPDGPGPFSNAVDAVVYTAPGPIVDLRTSAPPPNNESEIRNVTDEVTITWSPVENATLYEVQTALVEAFASVLSSADVAETTWSSTEFATGEYFARVRAVNGTAVGPWSEPTAFAVFHRDSPIGTPGIGIGAIVLALCAIAAARRRRDGTS